MSLYLYLLLLNILYVFQLSHYLLYLLLVILMILILYYNNILYHFHLLHLLFHYFTHNLPYIHLENDAQGDYADKNHSGVIRNRYHSILLFLLQSKEKDFENPNFALILEKVKPPLLEVASLGLFHPRGIILQKQEASRILLIFKIFSFFR